jgi:hypothetical protein
MRRPEARVRREAQTAAGLNHPNICVVHEVAKSDGVLFIPMERVNGRISWLGFDDSIAHSGAIRHRELSVVEAPTRQPVLAVYWRFWQGQLPL